MTLATHAVIAAAVTKSLMHAHPALTFAVAFASHFLADAIPHWDYKLVSLENPEDSEKRRFGRNRSALIRDVKNFTLDGFLGAGIVLLFVRPVTREQWIWAILAIVGGCLPDFLQGLYVLKIKFLQRHQKFHDMLHTNIRLGPYPLIGIPFQAVIAMIALYALK